MVAASQVMSLTARTAGRLDDLRQDRTAPRNIASGAASTAVLSADRFDLGLARPSPPKAADAIEQVTAIRRGIG